jgi:hypothetical protein
MQSDAKFQEHCMRCFSSIALQKHRSNARAGKGDPSARIEICLSSVSGWTRMF